MKNFISKAIILFVLFAFLGCSSDSDQDTSCLPITCFNGGVSTSDCGCDCPEGFTGADCFDQKTPTKVVITKIRVLSFPDKDSSGSYWDLLLGKPDIMVSLNNTDVLYVSDYYSDAINRSNGYDFTPKSPIQITKVSDFLSVQLFDYDEATIVTPEEVRLMGRLLFVPFTTPSTLPKSIIVENKNINLKIEIFVTYVFQ